MPITAEQAETQLAYWLAADTAVSSGQSFDHNGRSLTRVNAKEIRGNIDYWDAKCKALSSSGIKLYGGTPV